MFSPWRASLDESLMLERTSRAGEIRLSVCFSRRGVISFGSVALCPFSFWTSLNTPAGLTVGQLGVGWTQSSMGLVLSFVVKNEVNRVFRLSAFILSPLLYRLCWWSSAFVPLFAMARCLLQGLMYCLLCWRDSGPSEHIACTLFRYCEFRLISRNAEFKVLLYGYLEWYMRIYLEHPGTNSSSSSTGKSLGDGVLNRLDVVMLCQSHTRSNEFSWFSEDGRRDKDKP